MQTTRSDVIAAGRPSSAAYAQGTRTLLACGLIAGPLYLVVGLVQALTRPGFDLTRHALSVLSNGGLGWIQVTNFLLAGLLVIASAVGIRRALDSGPGRSWGPLLIAVYGLGMIGSAFFKADPALGFPVGTPADAVTITRQGMLHFMIGGVGFLALSAACLVFARRFAALRQRGWTTFSALTGVVFLATFVGIASGSGNPWTILGFWIGLVLAWSWLAALSAHLRAGVAFNAVGAEPGKVLG